MTFDVDLHDQILYHQIWSWWNDSFFSYGVETISIFSYHEW